MSASVVKVLFLGDVCGQSGNRALFLGLQSLRKEVGADFCLVNIENNAARGIGIDESSLDRLFALGIDGMTSGNHVWDIPGSYDYLTQGKPVLRPINYHKSLPGSGSTIIRSGDISLGVINAQGVYSMRPIQPPLEEVKRAVAEIRKETPLIVVDFHAESSEEKEALAYFLDGTVSAVVGTHTHVQTMDERVLPKGCGYITDLGMTGSIDGVIGFDQEEAVRRQVTQLPLQLTVSEGATALQGVVLTIDCTTGKTLLIERVSKKLSL